MNAKCYTFYSYKGGSGRTTTLLNTTKHLAERLGASKEHPILLIDADLESAGLTYFFDCNSRFTARFNCTLHAAAFLNRPKEVLMGIRGDNTFGVGSERLVSCEDISRRIASLYPSMNAQQLLKNVTLRETTAQILDSIVTSIEKKAKIEQGNEEVDEDCEYICKTYEISRLLRKLGTIDSCDSADVRKKRFVIENFLPTDGMVDVSHYFGMPEGVIKFIGADIAYTGRHVALNNLTAESNKLTIARECGKKGFSTILFDCGAGVQSTAHVLNQVSDVLVYCMRPTYQFVSGTYVQLERYSGALQAIVDRKQAKASEKGINCDQKSVILLPTAVPYCTPGTENLQDDSFSRIERIANKTFSSFVDNTFCCYENSLKEVSLFKWREHILGAKPIASSRLFEQMSEEMLTAIEPYSSHESGMPDDAKDAYKIYNLLAERLCYNT